MSTGPDWIPKPPGLDRLSPANRVGPQTNFTKDGAPGSEELKQRHNFSCLATSKQTPRKLRPFLKILQAGTGTCCVRVDSTVVESCEITGAHQNSRVSTVPTAERRRRPTLAKTRQHMNKIKGSAHIRSRRAAHGCQTLRYIVDVDQIETCRNADNNRKVLAEDFYPLQDSLTDKFWRNGTDTPMTGQTIATLITNHHLSVKQGKANKHRRNLAAASSS